MLRGLIVAATSGLLILSGILTQAAARGGLRSEDRWEPAHIDLLPQEIRQTLGRLAQACGRPPAAEHHFALYLSGARHQFIALHFEHFRCIDRTAICTRSTCLHQVYASSGGGYRLVWSGQVPDLEMKLIDDKPAIDVACEPPNAGCPHVLLWNGGRFVGR
jgi:hypothetical protein